MIVDPPTVLPLRVRVRSQENPFSPASETGFGGVDAPFPGKSHWDIRFGNAGTGIDAIVFLFSAVEGRRREEILEGIVRELSVPGESCVKLLSVYGESVIWL